MNKISEIKAMSLADRARRVAVVAAEFADQVDQQSRFPKEGIDAAKAERLMGIHIPVDNGGEGATMSEVAEVCSILGQACAATAMTYAMHQIQIASLTDHAPGSEWHKAFLKRICQEQLLIASATSEAGIGGNLRNSICAIEIEGDTVRLEKDATVISYGADADAIMVTSRRNRGGAAFRSGGDRLYKRPVHARKNLDLGYAGHARHLFGRLSVSRRSAQGAGSAQAIRRNRSAIHARRLAPFVGRVVVRHCRRRGQPRAGLRARRCPQVAGSDTTGRAAPGGGVQPAATGEVECRGRPPAVRDQRWRPGRTVGDGLCGGDEQHQDRHLANDPDHHQPLHADLRHLGYKNGTPFSLGRHLRDAHSAQLMISNDRILGNTSTMLLVQKQETSLLG